ncbi:MAG: MFS transporter, partial [Ginsengibacter sp.]
MRNWQIKTSLFLNYFVFAILLNSVGTVILQVQNNYGVTQGAASILEAFKDLSIAIASFLVASYITRIGYKRSMLLALALVILACLTMPVVGGFAMTKILFAATGASFALIKVSVYATIGLVTSNKKDHASFMNFIESFFMIGILAGYFIFGAFADNTNPTSTSWLHVYYLLAGLSALAFILLLT